MNTQEIIEKAISLPIEDRAQVVDSLIQSLNKTESEIEKKWAAVAAERLKNLRSGSVVTVSGEKVFERILKRL